MILPRTTFETALVPARLRVMQIMQGALLVGPTIFLLVILVLSQTGERPSPTSESVDNLTLLSMVNAVYALVAFGAGTFLFARIFNPDRLVVPETTAHGIELGQSALALLQTALLLRMGLLEGAAILGLAVCMIGWSNGVLPTEEVYWLNSGSVLLLFLTGVMLFPTKERVLQLFDRYFTS